MKLFPLLLLTAIGFGVSTRPFSCFPRMVDQPSVKPFEKRMPEAPPNQVPFAGPAAPEPTEEQAAAMRNPAAPSAESVERGRLYYGYYCQMCHGAAGVLPGPVGESYVPAPTDLTSAKVAAMSDGALAYAMVRGTGHDPALESTVLLERRWHIVNFVRTLGEARGGEQSAPRQAAGTGSSRPRMMTPVFAHHPRVPKPTRNG
jgi:mono/diheme cytochrome c family protein